MRTWTAAAAVCLVALAGVAPGEPPVADPLQQLGVDLLTIQPTNAVERKALGLAEKLVGKPSGGLKTDIARAKQLAKLLEKHYGNNVLIDNDLDAVLTELEGDVTSQHAALAQRAANEPDGKAKTQAQARADAANAKLVSARAAAEREAKANGIGAALQDVLKGESYLKDDTYFYAVVNGEALFLTHMFDNTSNSGGFINADSSGGIFVLQAVGPYDAGPPNLHDVVSMAVSGMPKAREYTLQDYMTSHSRQDHQANAPDGFRRIVVTGSDSFVKFLRVDTKKRIVAGIFQFTVHEDTDATKVDRVKYGSFRATYR